MDRQQTSPQDSIQVLVRIKPGNDDEAVIYTPNEIKIEKHTFAFDKIFSPDAHQQDVYNAVGKKLLINTLQGYNSCVFVYGQTGSGKTYTMMGDNTGLMQRSFNQLYSRLDRIPESECIVTCSYYQLYNEQIIDLLDTRKQKRNLSIRQDVKKGVFVQNLTEQSALNADKLLQCLNIGMKNRHIGQTMMNRQSSRSHSIFTISLAIKSQLQGKKILKTPKLHFVDLAGSERQKMTNASGDRLKEAGNINKSLTTLGMVINALASDKTKTHIPYRDSKLTCLLRDSLGGNSKTFIVATISTSILCFQQTLSTLNFANRAKMVKVKALINEQSLSTNIQQFKEQIRRLKQEIAKLKSDKKVSFDSCSSTPRSTDSIIPKTSTDLQSKFIQLSLKLQQITSNISSANIQPLLPLLQKVSNSQMIDQSSQGNHQQSKELIQYLSSNSTILQKIRITINDYKLLKQQIKNVEFSRRMPMQQIRTPSKFQRDQYQELLDKRDEEIKMLDQKVREVKEISLKKECQNRQLRRKLLSLQDCQESKQESIIRLQSDRDGIEQKYSQLQLQYEMTCQKSQKMHLNTLQLQLRLKQSKQLYHYQQQKLQNQKQIRTSLQQTVKSYQHKISALQKTHISELQVLNQKIYSLQQSLQYHQRNEQQLKNEVQILSTTIEFNQKKIKQYSDKNHECQECMIRMEAEIAKGRKELENQKIAKEQMGKEMHRKIEELSGQNQQLVKCVRSGQCALKRSQDQLKRSQEQKRQVKKEYQQYKNTSKEWISLLQTQLLQERQLVQAKTTQLQQLSLRHTQSVDNYESTVNSLTTSLEQLRAEQLHLQNQKQALLQTTKSLQSELSTLKQSHKSQTQTLNQKITSQSQTISKKVQKLQTLQTYICQNKNSLSQHEQLKKLYKQILKQNYKLKNESNTNNHNYTNQSQKNEELISKVAYYEQKFRLMSIEYNKVQEISKKLKQKEMSLMKKVEYYQQNQKIQKITTKVQQTPSTQTLNNLHIQNKELKMQLNKITSLYETKLQNQKKQDYSKRLSLQHYKYELQQKQNKIRKKLQNVIKNWDYNKQNNCSDMGLDQMFCCWEKIQAQSKKKIQGINKAIKRQQKLKIQNGFIVKENTYLKERVQTLQREIGLSAICQPRKIIKCNQNLVQNN